jgi:DUF971 family protein
VEFNNGDRFAYPAEYLRVESPAAEPVLASGKPRVWRCADVACRFRLLVAAASLPPAPTDVDCCLQHCCVLHRGSLAGDAWAAACGHPRGGASGQLCSEVRRHAVRLRLAAGELKRAAGCSSTLHSHPGRCCRRLCFDDLHSSGIYTWPYLHALGAHKRSRMRRSVGTR